MAQAPGPASPNSTSPSAASGAHLPTEYHRGDMEVGMHRSMYMRFNGMVHWGSTIIATLLTFLVLWLCAHIAFIGAAIVAAIVLAVGVWMNRNTGHNAGY